MTDWTDRLQQASFRGVPFGVSTSDGEFGRRQAVHEYPKRDKPWVEDLGRATRRISFVGFLIENSLIYGGGDVLGQRDRFVAAAEQEGSGTLVHPTLGQLTISLLRATVRERWDVGRYFEIEFVVIESGDKMFPSATTDGGSKTVASALSLDIATALNFVAQASALLKKGQAIIQRAVQTVAGWVSIVTRLGNDATSLAAMIGHLPGSFGRFFGGKGKGYQSSATQPASDATVGSLILAGATARATITAAQTAFVAAAASGSAQGAADAAQAVIAALLAATVDPADQIRLLTPLAVFTPDLPASASLTGDEILDVQAAYGALLRRSALAGLARASVNYQPWSQDDAALLRDRLTALFDLEITVAGDTGDDDSYKALKAARAAMVQDLNARGAALPPMQIFELGAPVPSLVLAQKLYQDPGRDAELVFEANPAHPAFMPTRFAALSR